MANKPRTPNNNVLVVDTGVPVTANGIPAIVLRMETATLQELKQGRYVLVPRQIGFTRKEKCLLYKDETGEYHYLYNSEALKEQLYVKDPVATPEYLPSTDLIGVLRYVNSEDQYYMNTESGWQPVTAHTDKRLDEEIARAIARENEIEGKARGINVTDNRNGSLTFTNYEGEESVIPTGKKVQSTDGTVEVTENANDFDLSIQYEIDSRLAAEASLQTDIDAVASDLSTETQNRIGAVSALQAEIDGIETAIDLDVETDTQVSSDEDNVTLSTEYTNIKTGLQSQNNIALPTVSQSTAGFMDAAMFTEFGVMQGDIAELYALLQGLPRTAVCAGLGSNPSQVALTAAFTAAIGSPPNANDRLVNIDNNTEWILDNSGTWQFLSAAEIELATQTNAGLAQHSGLDGCVGYYVAGVGQVNGWSDLKAAVAANTASISGLQATLNSHIGDTGNPHRVTKT